MTESLPRSIKEADRFFLLETGHFSVSMKHWGVPGIRSDRMSLFRHFLSVGSATMASRILGFVRDMLIAMALGAGPVADAFVVAFRLPNLFRRLFSEGAFNTAFVPVHARLAADEGEPVARRFAGDLLGLTILAAVALTGLAMLVAPLLVRVLAPGFVADPLKFDQTVLLSRVCLPYLAFLSIGSVLSGVLANARRYWIAAVAPVLLNVVTLIFLAGILAFGLAHSRQAGLLLAIAVSVSGLAQLFLLILGALRFNLLPRPRWPATGRHLRRLAALAAPGFVAAGIVQINIVIGTIIASHDAGAVSVLYYADRLYQLPLGVVGIAIGMVLLPETTLALSRGRDDIARDAQNRSLEFAALLTLPATVALMIAAAPIVEILFERGAFGPVETARTTSALIAFAIGLPAFVGGKILATPFFAREDTRTPMLAAAVSAVVNVVGAIALFGSMAETGIALATSIAGWTHVLLLWFLLWRRGNWHSDLQLETTLIRALAASLVMGAVLWLLIQILLPWTGAENPVPIKVGALVALVGGGLATYLALAHQFGAVDLGDIRARFLTGRTPKDGDILPP